jgi:hypothetical protein
MATSAADVKVDIDAGPAKTGLVPDPSENVSIKVGKDHKPGSHDYMRLGFFSWLTFWWVTRVITYFRNARGQAKHLPPVVLHQRETATYAHAHMETKWREELIKSAEQKRYELGLICPSVSKN